MIDLEVQVEPFGQCVDEPVGFREQVTRVDKNDRNVRHLAGDEVQRNGGLHTETRGQYMLCRQVFEGPFDPVFGGFCRHEGVAVIECMLSRCLFVEHIDISEDRQIGPFCGVR